MVAVVDSSYGWNLNLLLTSISELSYVLGVEDKAVMLEKCGAPIRYNPDAIGSSDVMLIGGNFKVWGSNRVRGVA